MIDVGHGAPVVLIPGIQGRWEWMGPAVDALSKHCRVVTGSLAGDRGSIRSFDVEAGFENYISWIDDLLERASLNQAAVCGVSYGGLVALHYAATHCNRVTALILTSTPSPTWRPSFMVEQYLKAPRLLSPAFVLSSPFRLYSEITAALPNPIERCAFTLTHLYRVIRHSFSPARMAERVRLLNGVDFASDCQRINTPTLVITGDPELDRVVPVKNTHEYLRVISGAVHSRLANTGHIGLVTRPQQFADIVTSFITTHASAKYPSPQVPT